MLIEPMYNLHLIGQTHKEMKQANNYTAATNIEGKCKNIFLNFYLNIYLCCTI